MSPAPRSRAWLPRPALAALVAALAAVAVIGAVAYRSLAARFAAAAAVSHTEDVEDHLHRFLSAMKDAETGQRGFLLTGTERYLDPYQLALGNIAAERVELRRLTLDNLTQQRRLEVVAPLVDAKLAELRQTIELRRAGDTAGALAVVQSDRGKRLLQLFSNVIANALAHGEAGSAIAVRVAGGSRDIVVEVGNRGAIPPERLATLFEPFRRELRPAARASSHGLGLGRFISRQIALAHGGDIEVASSAAAGTTVMIRLPRTGETTAEPATEAMIEATLERPGYPTTAGLAAPRAGGRGPG